MTLSYRIRAGWETTDWAEVSSLSDTWDVAAVAYYWDELNAGPVPNEDVLAIRVVRRMGDLFSRVAVGDCDFVANNDGGRICPCPSTGARPNQVISIKGVTDAGSVYGLFNGHIRSVSIDPQLGDRALKIRAEDHARQLENEIDMDIMFNTTVGSLTYEALRAADVPKEEIRIDGIQDSIDFAWLDGIGGGEAAQRVINAGAHFIAIDGFGRTVVKDRNYTEFLSAVASYAQMFAMDFALDDDRIINDARVISEPRRLSSSVQTVAWIDEVITVPISKTVSIFMNYVDTDNANEENTPVASLASLTASTDYFFSTSQSGGESITSTSIVSVSVVPFATRALVEISHVHSLAGYMQRLSLSGLTLQRQAQFKSQKQDSDSQNKYRRHDFELENNLIRSSRHADTYAEYLVDRYKDPQADIGITIKNEDPDVLQREIFDIIHVVNSQTNVASDFIVTGVKHTINFMSKGTEHQVGMQLRLSNIGNYLILDDADRGKLDDINVLGF